MNKLWNIAIQEDLVTTTFTTSNYVLPTYEIIINNVLLFTCSFMDFSERR